MHHGIFPPVSGNAIGMGCGRPSWLCADEPVCPCTRCMSEAVQWPSSVKPSSAGEKRAGPGGHCLHTRRHALLSCDECNRYKRSPCHFKWIRLPFNIEENWQKPPCHCWCKQGTGHCHYRNIQVKDTAAVWCDQRPWPIQNMKHAHSFRRDWAETFLSRSVVPPPLLVTQKSMSELWRIIIDERQGHSAVQKREASEASSTNPRLHSSVPIDLSGLYF